MTDAEFERFMAKLLRTVDADTRGTTRLAQRYAEGAVGASTTATCGATTDLQIDAEFHKYNDEWTRT